MKKPLMVRVAKKIKEHIKSVDQNVIEVEFGARFHTKDFSQSSIVIGSNPRPTTLTLIDSSDDTEDEIS